MMTPQQLKNSILQRAIEGKLVEQRPEEGTAKELLKAIKAEKAKLIKEKKIKKSAPLPPISQEEIPFHVPESWEWVRLDDLVVKDIKRGKSPKYVYNSNVLVFAQKCNTKAGIIDLDLAKFLDEVQLNKYPDCEFMQSGDIVINSTGTGTLGRVGIFLESDNKSNRKIVPDSHVTVIRISSSVSKKFLFYALKNSQSYIETLGEGSTKQKELKTNTISNLFIPLPPFAEQKRIVAKIEELLPLVEEYNKAYTKLATLNAKFPEDMKKSILQYAIEGKLVEQRPEEGTAKELLKAIKAEKARLIKEKKIKKSAPLPPISQEEIPFELPESWEWVRLGEIFNMQAGNNISAASISHSINDEHPFLCYGGNGVRGYVSDYNRDGVYPLIGRQGALCGNVHLAQGKFYATEHAVVTELFANTNAIWAKYFLVAINLNQYATATAQPGLAVSKVENVLLPLPPLAEQKRIVDKIEELLPLCEQLANDGR